MHVHVLLANETCQLRRGEKKPTVCQSVLCSLFEHRHWDRVAPLPKSEDSERSVGLVTGVATQVTAPEVIVPDVAQGCGWSQILGEETREFA